MNCADKTELLQGMLDDELDLPALLEFEAHLKTCADCAAEYEAQRRLRASLREALPVHSAPAALRQRITTQLDLDRQPAPASLVERVRRRIESWGLLWFVTTVAACMALIVVAPRQPDPLQGLVDSHVQSLLGEHLTDVASTDQHTVKPWFDGKTDIAPPVADLADKGFPLVGGRLAYLNERVAPVLVYKRHKHVINLFIERAPGASWMSAQTSEYHGYHVVRWTWRGLAFAAVSDVNVAELKVFCDDYQTVALQASGS